MASFDYTYDYALFSLSNSSDEIILSRPDSSIVAAIYYNDDDFPDPRGASMVFTGTPAADINIGTNWSNSLLPNESSPNFSLVEKGSPGIRGVQQGLLYTLINGLTEATPTLPLNTFSESFDAPTIDLSLNEQAITAPSIMIK